MYGPPSSILRDAVLLTRLLMGLVGATVAAEGDADEVEDTPRRGTEARGESKGSGSVRGGSCGGECSMVIALSQLPCDSKVVVKPKHAFCVCGVGWGREGNGQMSFVVGLDARMHGHGKDKDSRVFSDCRTHYGENW